MKTYKVKSPGTVVYQVSKETKKLYPTRKLPVNKIIQGNPIHIDYVASSGVPMKGRFIQVAFKEGTRWAFGYISQESVLEVIGRGGKAASSAEGDKDTTAPPVMTALPGIMSSAGFLCGLYFAFDRKSDFWGYVGYSFLGSIGGMVAGSLIKTIAYPASQSFSGAAGVAAGDVRGGAAVARRGGVRGGLVVARAACGAKEGLDCDSGLKDENGKAIKGTYKTNARGDCGCSISA